MSNIEEILYSNLLDASRKGMSLYHEDWPSHLSHEQLKLEASRQYRAHFCMDSLIRVGNNLGTPYVSGQKPVYTPCYNYPHGMTFTLSHEPIYSCTPPDPTGPKGKTHYQKWLQSTLEEIDREENGILSVRSIVRLYNENRWYNRLIRSAIQWVKYFFW